MSAQIFFNAYNFASGTSRPWLSRKAQYITDAPGGIPQRALVEYTVKTWFLEPSFADNQTRYRALLAAIEGAMEGVLRMVDENGTEILNVRVRPVSHDLPEQWGQYMEEVTVAFHANEDLTSVASTSSIVYTPEGGAPLTLPNVTHYAENIRATRYSPNVWNRRETVGAIVATGRTQADSALSPADRRAYLLAQKALIQAASDCASGTLAFAGASQLCQIDVLDANLDDATDQLIWSLQASYLRFPAGTYAEAEFSVKQRDNLQASERITSVQGKVRSNDEAGALAKIAALQTAYTTSGLMLISQDSSEARLSGADGDTFVDIDFSFEFRSVLAVTSYKLSVVTRDDTKTGQIIISYTGSVTSTNSTTALTQARSLGDGKYPVRMSAQETVETISAASGGPQLTQVTFAYEYLTKGSALYAEVESAADYQIFGSNAQLVTGYAVADTQANALTLARSFQLSGLLLTGNRESIDTLQKDTTGIFVKVTFSYAYRLTAMSGSIEYGVKVSENFQTRERTVTYSGTAYGADEATADTLINGVATDGSGTKLTNERESKWDKSGAITMFLSRSFSISFVEAMSAGGYDVLEAEYTIEKIYSVDKAILTFIPKGTPDVQTGQGVTIGYTRVSGRMTCLNIATAKTFARALQPAGGYVEEGGRERFGTKYLPFSATSVKCVTMDFEYSMAYTDLVMT